MVLSCEISCDELIGLEDSEFGSDRVDDMIAICTPAQVAIIGILVQAYYRQINPAPFLVALANELTVAERIVIKRVAQRFEEGESFIDAVEFDNRILPSPVLLAFRIAHDAGSLREFCRTISNRSIYVPTTVGLSDQSPARQILWLGWSGLFLSGVMAFVMLFIIPQFEEIFAEFGLELPAVTILLIDTVDFVCHWWFIFFGLVMLAVVPYILPCVSQIRRCLSPTRWRQKTFPEAVQTKYNLARLVKSRLAVADGLGHFMRLGGRATRMRSLEKARQRIAQGQSPWKALAIEHVLTDRESNAVEIASSPELKAWLLRYMATAQSQRLDTWSVARFRVISIFANAVYALLVLFFCIALFAPLIWLIGGLV